MLQKLSLKRFNLATIAKANRRFSMAVTAKPLKVITRNTLPFEDTAEDYDFSRRYKQISLDEFYSDIAEMQMSDEEALELMTYAAKLAAVRFTDEAEMMSFKSDFMAALSFIRKLDDVDTEGIEHLGNVWEYYKGNQEKMRNLDDNESEKEMHFTQKSFAEINKHSNGTYSVLPFTKHEDDDGEN